MNKLSKNKLLENRFESDANQGYELVHGSREFFDGIKSPFGNQPKAGSISSWGFLSLEIVVAVALLGTAKLIDISTSSNEFAFAPKTVMQEVINKSADVSVDFIVEAEKNPIKDINFKGIPEPVLPSSFSTAIVADSTPVLYTLEENGVIEKMDSITTIDPKFAYTYADNKSKYELRYVEELLVIDYTDTLFTGIKLEPVLSGVPAPFENKDKINSNNIRNESAKTFVKTNGYLDELHKPLRLLMQKKYTNALKGFKGLLKTEPNDQNALFYGGLAFYNTGNYNEAKECFEKIKILKDPLFEEDADWLLVRIYAETGDQTRSLVLLNQIAHSNSFYREKALEEIKK